MTDSPFVGVLALPMPVTELAARTRELEDAHGPGLVLVQHAGHWLIARPGAVETDCACARCVHARTEAVRAHTPDAPWWLGTGVGMIVCARCGNKRCPHATWHENECTDSNEPGQAGSAYA